MDCLISHGAGGISPFRLSVPVDKLLSNAGDIVNQTGHANILDKVDELQFDKALSPHREGCFIQQGPLVTVL